MSFFRLLLENLWFHWRGNLAVFLGVVVGTAALTGALIVGDSLRGSLRQLTAEQLGWVDQTLINTRFFNEDTARDPETKKVVLPADHVAPTVLLQATVVKLSKETLKPVGATARKVTLIGADKSFWGPEPEKHPNNDLSVDFLDQEIIPPVVIAPTKQGTTYSNAVAGVLGKSLADDLDVEVGDAVLITLQKESGAPRESLLGKRDTEDVLDEIAVKVKTVLPANHFGSRFHLKPGATLPRNMFLPLRVLQDKLIQQQPKGAGKRRFPTYPINALLVDGGQTTELADALKPRLNLTDYGLAIRRDIMRDKDFNPFEMKYVSLESRAMFIPPFARKAVEESKLRHAPTLVYLVNNMARAGSDKIEVPYCVVAALDPTRKDPLGPIAKEKAKLADDEILLVEWDDNPLANVKKGEKIDLTYFEPNDQGNLREKTTTFRLAGHVPMSDARKDPYLTPLFPGVTDRTKMADWKAPFPFDSKRITSRDDDYWDSYRTTPKAYITLAAGQKLWGSRYGDITSIRIVPSKDVPKDKVGKTILEHIDPSKAGFVFTDIRANNLEAGGGSQDFSGLFLGFSCFLIMAALLLIGLLFRLNIDHRASEIGLLMAVGHKRSTLRRMLLLEGTMLSVIGAVLGLMLAVWYAGWLLDFLRDSWPDQSLDWSFLQLKVTPLSLIIGFLASVFVSVATIFWSIRILGQVSPRNLLSGVTTIATTPGSANKPFWSKIILAGSVVIAIGCMGTGPFLSDPMMRAMMFMLSGMFLLFAGLAFLWIWLKRSSGSAVREGGWLGLAGLGTRNSGRHPARSLLTMGLLAFATFLVVAVQAFQRDSSSTFLQEDGGSGGYAFVAQTDVPVFLDLNDKQVRKDQKLDLPKDTRFVSMRMKQGDDISCMNLYKPMEPRILGIPDSIIDGGGFRFAETLAKTEEERKNPWLLLRRKTDNGEIPVLVEKNTATYTLKTGLGQTLNVDDDAGNSVTLLVVGFLQDSVFQSELLMADDPFRKSFPHIEGFQYFLIDAPTAKSEQITKQLEEGQLSRYGFTVELSGKKLETYLAVQNTYLATFQVLGGFGLLLGALGLAVVLLRSVWERRGELALFRALGFRKTSLAWLVLAENLYLLILGLFIGTFSALIAVTPHMLSGSDVKWLDMILLLSAVLVVGLVATTIAVATTMRAPLIAALRKE